MAAQKPTKTELYRMLYRVNNGFTSVVEQLRQFEATGMFSGKDFRTFQANAQELQAEINDTILETMQPIEERDTARFERIRMAREKELRDPNDVFLQAEERRQELKRNRR
jgi:hypothetical protein